MPWFRHPESGQVFEAVGNWEKEARSRGCEEIDDPTSPKPEKKAEEPKPEKVDAKQPESQKEKTPEPEPKPEKADAKGGKEKK